MATPSRGRGVSSAPEKGVFPLDHDGECKAAMKAVLECIRENDAAHMACREFSKAYLQCRMDKELMQREDLTKLGFAGGDEEDKKMEVTAPSRSKEKEGFVAGTYIKQRKGAKDWF